MSDILLNQDDTYEIQLASIITSYDEKVLFRLYQPIIGYGPINLFLTLFNELEGERIVSTGVKTHSRLFEIMLINNLKFVKFRKYLEALGLLKTFVLETENVNRYVYKLYAPLAPDKFFTHPILNNLLKRNISIEEYERTKLYFVNKVGVKASYKDVSCNINDVFFNDIKNIKMSDDSDSNENIKERLEADVVLPFDFEAFSIGLKDYQIPKKVLTTSILRSIASFAVLYKINAIDMRQVVAQSIDIIDNEKKVNLDKLEHFSKIYYDLNVKNTKKVTTKVVKENVKVNLLPGESLIAKKVQLFNEITPLEFLKIRNNNIEPLSCDVKLISKIKSNTELLDPVINVLLDYSLEKLDNKLIPAYVEKVAASLSRENIKDAYEAMLYLNGKVSRKSKVNEKVTPKKEDVKEVKQEENIEEEYKWW